VVDAGGDHRLAQEAAPEAVVGRQVRPQDLERDLAAEVELHRPVHLAHTAAPDAGLDAVAGDLDARVALHVHGRVVAPAPRRAEVPCASLLPA